MKKISFILLAHSVVLTRVGEHVDLPPIVVLNTATEGNKIDFALDLNPQEKYKLTEVSSIEHDEPLVGRPWGYADRKMVFGKLAENPEKLIFWANELELTILPTAKCFKELVSYLRS